MKLLILVNVLVHQTLNFLNSWPDIEWNIEKFLQQQNVNVLHFDLVSLVYEILKETF